MCLPPQYSQEKVKLSEQLKTAESEKKSLEDKVRTLEKSVLTNFANHTHTYTHTHPSIHPFIHPSIHPPIHPSIHLSMTILSCFSAERREGEFHGQARSTASRARLHPEAAHLQKNSGQQTFTCRKRVVMDRKERVYVHLHTHM